uniref:Cytochrome P450 n=1 Tax=Brassica campestris TaxID=3711 RepID=A0A3P6CH67_BRACM|nr:unnamed protein product [Brassica rapa]
MMVSSVSILASLSPYILISALLLYLLLEQLTYLRKKGNLPGPLFVPPIIGNAVSVVRDPTSFWYKQSALAGNSPGLSANYLVGRFIVYIRDTELSHQIFTNVRPDAFHFVGHPFGKKLFGDHNFIYMFGDDHKSVRRQIAPNFTPKALSTYSELMQVIILRHLRLWEESCNGPITTRKQGDSDGRNRAHSSDYTDEPSPRKIPTDYGSSEFSEEPSPSVFLKRLRFISVYSTPSIRREYINFKYELILHFYIFFYIKILFSETIPMHGNCSPNHVKKARLGAEIKQGWDDSYMIWGLGKRYEGEKRIQPVIGAFENGRNRQTHVLGNCRNIPTTLNELVQFVGMSSINLTITGTFPNFNGTLCRRYVVFGIFARDFRRKHGSSEFVEKFRRKSTTVTFISLNRNVVGSSSCMSLRNLVRDLNLETSQTVFVGPYLDEEDKNRFRTDYNIFNLGTMTLPFDIPGSAFHKARMAVKRLANILAVCARKSKARMAAGEEPTCLIDFWMQPIVAEAASGNPPPPHSRDEEIGGFLFDFLFAAQDASTSSLLWAVTQLESKPDVLRRVREEVGSIWTPESNALITVDQLAEMKYTLNVAREVVRYRPPATMVPHVAAVDFPLTKTYTVPKGTIVFPSVFDSSFQGFTEPDRFDPDRFSEARKEDQVFKRNFLAFGWGSHQCVGQRYALNHLVLFIAMFSTLLDFKRVRSDGCDEIVYCPTISPKDGCTVFLSRRVAAYPDLTLN